MAILGTIDPNLDELILGGVQVTGYGDDDHMTITRNEDITNFMSGNSGDQTIIINPDRTGTLVVRVQETSPTNQQLWNYLTLIQAGASGGIFPVRVKRAESSQLEGTRGWLMSQPEVSYGKEVKVYEWSITLEDATMGIAAGLTNVVGIVN